MIRPMPCVTAGRAMMVFRQGISALGTGGATGTARAGKCNPDCDRNRRGGYGWIKP